MANTSVSTVFRWLLALSAAAGLGIDAYTHLNLASLYSANQTSVMSQGDLFVAEAVLAIVAGVFVLARPRRAAAALVFAVTGGGLALLLIYRYVNVGRLGPVPNMYEPVWFPEKTLSAAGEAGAALASLMLFLLPRPHQETTHGPSDELIVAPARAAPAQRST